MKYAAAMFTASALVAANLAVAGLAAQSATPLPYGEELFAQRCRACHSVTTAKPNLIGPNLAGVVGRKAAATAFNYSTALKNSKLIWTKANLHRYLAAPARAVPGTKMFMAVPDAKQRTAIVTFLEKAK